MEYCSVWENNINSPLWEACILFYQFSLTHDLPAELGQPPLIKTEQGFCSKLREYWMKSIYDGCYSAGCLHRAESKPLNQPPCTSLKPVNKHDIRTGA